MSRHLLLVALAVLCASLIAAAPVIGLAVVFALSVPLILWDIWKKLP
jgi:hypothetical protein